MPKPMNQFARFTKATDDLIPRIVAASVGEAGSGKTTWWLGAPGPIVVQTLDQGLEGVVEPFAKHKDIYVADYTLGLEPGGGFTHAAAVEARDKFIDDFEHAIQHARTVVWDRESDMWNLFFYAEFGTDDAFAAAPPKDWDKMKGKIRRLIAMAKATNINFGLIQGMKNEWVSKVNKNTGAKAAAQSGNRIRSGMDDVESLVHIDLEHSRVKKNFTIHVHKSRGPSGHELQDESFVNTSFSEFASLVFPDSDPAIWA